MPATPERRLRLEPLEPRQLDPAAALGREADQLGVKIRALELKQRGAHLPVAIDRIDEEYRERTNEIGRLRAQEEELRALSQDVVKKDPAAIERAKKFFDTRSAESANELRIITRSIDTAKKERRPEYMEYAKWERLHGEAHALAEFARTAGRPVGAADVAVKSLEAAMAQTSYGAMLKDQEGIQKKLKDFQDVRAQLDRKPAR